MANRSYLYIKGKEILFESSNTFPLFWIFGFSKETFTELRMMNSIEDYDNTVNIPVQEYYNNLKSKSNYIEFHYPTLINIYSDFLNIILEEVNKKTSVIVGVDYTEYLWFYESFEYFYFDISELFETVKKNQKTDWIDENAIDILVHIIGSDLYLKKESKTLFSDLETYEKVNNTCVSPQSVEEKSPSLIKSMKKFFLGIRFKH